MENNFDQEKLKRRVLEKLQNKIASEEFKNKENIQKGEKRKSKNNGFKVAVILMVGMLVGNGYTYATYNENLFSFILSRAGIISDYNEKSTVLEQDGVAINNNSLTLSSYVMDQENLVITYKLKLAEKVEKIEEFFWENPRIVDHEKTYTISENARISFYKISDSEYEFVRSYDVRNLEVSNDARFVTSVTLFKKLTDYGIKDILGIWDFDVNIIKNNSEESKVYTLKNNVIDIYNKDGSRAQFITFNEEPENLSVKIEELRLTDLATRIIYSADLYSGLKIFVEILDENGNVLLENNTEELYSSGLGEILFAKVNLNLKIIINIDIVGYDNEVIAEGSTTLDLSKDLIKKNNEKEELNYTEIKWNEISFSINDNMRIEERNNITDILGRDKIINNAIYTNEYGFKNYEDYIEIARCENDLPLEKYSLVRYISTVVEYRCFFDEEFYNKDLELTYEEIEEMIQERKIIKDGNEITYKEYYNDYLELTYEEIVKLAEEGKIIKNGKEITIEALKEKADRYVSPITNKKYHNKEVYEYDIFTKDEGYKIYILEINNYKYEFKIPTKLNISNEIEKFVSSIKII